MPIPTYYTFQEGGLWWPWKFGEIQGLPLGVDTCNTRVFNGIKVHALALTSPFEDAEYARWDCVNGMTKF